MVEKFKRELGAEKELGHVNCDERIERMKHSTDNNYSGGLIAKYLRIAKDRRTGHFIIIV